MKAGESGLFVRPPVPAGLLQAARALRQHMTDAEQLLWFCLRRKQVGGFRFRRQHPFQKFVLDFYCSETRVAIELDGGQHNQETCALGDRERSKILEAQGIVVLRFWNHDVLQNLEGVLEVIYEALLQRKELAYDRGRRIPPP